MLVLSLKMGLSTKPVDYTAAIRQAAIKRVPKWDTMTDEERDPSGVYIKMPRGFHTPGHVLKLNKSIYGLKESPRNFSLYLKEKPEECGYKQSMAD
jgi:hypothetical protein